MLSVLVSRDLLGCIFPYQYGVFEDLLPFCKDHGMYTRNTAHSSFLELDKKIRPWYNIFGFARLPILLEQVPKFIPAIFEHAAYFGLFEEMSILFAMWPLSQTYCLASLASANNQIAMVIHLTELQYVLVREDFDIAVMRGHTDMVDYYINKTAFRCWNHAINEAMAQGRLDILERIRDAKQWPGYTAEGVHRTAKCGRADVLLWLHENYGQNDLASVAVANDRLDLLEQVFALGHHPTVKDVDLAISKGYLEIVEYLALQTDLLSPPHTDEIIALGNLALLEKMHIRSKWPGFTSNGPARAAANGDVDVVRWLHSLDETHSPKLWSKWTMDQAAGHGHLEIVQFLQTHRSEGCSKWAMDLALENRHFAVAHYLVAQRDEGPSHYVFISAARRGDIQVIGFLHAFYPTHQGWTTDLMDEAARNGHLDVVCWLHKHRGEGCSKWAISLAEDHGHSNIAKLLTEWNICPTQTMDVI
ncbi:hypothetical protein LEN26_002762 [Aphanomyces euteiches]|nr:hypothetical protein AeMF1_003046 [Aphanomyces euteiches]KAH9158732.1 hypothetical protein LEN26_002762 [Aphanomyces euteiches]KAH9190997.1 hypothetical protein AeNC1_007022 [Aphanomyces euteiches]